MLCAQIISADFPTLSTEETVADFHSLSQKSGETLIPLLKEEVLVGLVFKEDLRTMTPETLLSAVPARPLSAHGDEHFLSAMKIMMLTQIPILPVMNGENNYLGVITETSLLHALGILMDIRQSSGAIISLQMAKTAYSFTELARLVESNDTNITQLNSYLDVQTDRFIVTLRLDKADVSDIISTLQRYDYHVVYFWGDELYENELKRNYNALMNYLSI